MTAPELIAQLRELGLIEDARKFAQALLSLAMRIPEARLADGQGLIDATDFEAWLIELAREVRKGKAAVEV